ncbi:MAG: hypothetical protein ACFE0I_25820 [Elainellaceae cyanobacterium]
MGLVIGDRQLYSLPQLNVLYEALSQLFRVFPDPNSLAVKG